MFAIRRRLTCVVLLWLAGQVAGVAAAPLAFCCHSVRTEDDDICCPGLKPGQICPMHHAREGHGTCKMRSACGGADAGLISLAGVVGLLPQVTTVVRPIDLAGASGSAAPSTLLRAYRPESPPPRA